MSDVPFSYIFSVMMNLHCGNWCKCGCIESKVSPVAKGNCSDRNQSVYLYIKFIPPINTLYNICEGKMTIPLKIQNLIW
jgi:hypothetical protein